MKHTLALVAHGELDPSLKSKILSYDFIIAVDGGLCYLDQMGIAPQLLLGDEDSTSPELFKKYPHLPKKTFPKDKDHTDLELAIREALDLKPASIHVFGALGKRLDHTLANLHLLLRYQKEVTFEGVRVISNETAFPTTPGQTLSLFALGAPATGVTTKGLKWELNKAVIDTAFFSQSNEALGNEVTISLESGSLLLI